jgi:replicative DNA helicase
VTFEEGRPDALAAANHNPNATGTTLGADGCDGTAGDRQGEGADGWRQIGFAELLAKLGRAPNETVTLCSDGSGEFRCVGRPYVNHAAEVVEQYKDANCWFGVNPVTPLADYGRGKAADITRLAAVPADLDFADDKCGSPETAFKILEDLSTVLGLPTAISGSGHGLQPFWTISDGEITAEFTTAQAAALLARVHALVAEVADHHGAKVDNVFDLPRVMRVPETVNTKPRQEPVTAVCFDGGGAPLTVGQLTAILEERGIPEKPPRRERRSSAGRSHARGNRQPDSIIDDYLTEGKMSPKVMSQLAVAMDHCHALSLRGNDCSRHGNIRDDVLALAGLGKRGEPGVSGAIKLLRAEFIEEVGPDRGYDTAAREFESFLDRERLEKYLDDEEYVEDDLFGGYPIPLTHRVDISEFPTDALPKAIADMVNGVAEATQVDLAMPATSALSALSACTGGHAVIETRPGWCEPLNLYTVAIAEPGERKSAVQSFMVSPIYAAEESLAAANRAARIEAETERQVATRNAERLRNTAASAAANATPQERATALSQAQMAALYAESLEVPPVPRLVADNITPEKVASLLAEQGGRLAIITAEGGIFDIIAGRYSKSNLPDLDIWLKGHSGDRLKVDRIGREPENIPHPALTLGLMIQPAVLAAIATRQDFRGRGLLARFLYTRPVSKVGHRSIGTPVDSKVEAAYHDAVKDLATGMAAWGGDNRAVLTLTEDARREFERIEAAVEPSLAKDGELALLVDWGSKYAGAVARVAGILHLADHGASKGTCSSVSVETILAAERIGEYFKAAAINVFTEMGTDQVTVDAIFLLERIHHLGQDEVSERDLFTAASRGRFRTTEDLRSVLRRLVDHGYLIPLPKPKPLGAGRPVSPRYRVHKVIAETAQTTERRS